MGAAAGEARVRGSPQAISHPEDLEDELQLFYLPKDPRGKLLEWTRPPGVH